MKLRDTFAIALLFFISISYGQEGFYYQAVIRNIDGSPMRNTPIQLKLSLLNSDTVLFEESHQLETNANGLIHATLSSGEVVSGDWNSIDCFNKKKLNQLRYFRFALPLISKCLLICGDEKENSRSTLGRSTN